MVAVGGGGGRWSGMGRARQDWGALCFHLFYYTSFSLRIRYAPVVSFSRGWGQECSTGTSGNAVAFSVVSKTGLGFLQPCERKSLWIQSLRYLSSKPKKCYGIYAYCCQWPASKRGRLRGGPPTCKLRCLLTSLCCAQ